MRISFSFVGWSLGPTIGYIGQKFKWNKFLKDKGVKSKQINNKSGFWGTNNNTHFVYYFEGDEKIIWTKIEKDA